MFYTDTILACCMLMHYEEGNCLTQIHDY